ncbi:MAG TPA: dTDP-4-dehydrorhamnose reductase [Bacteroidales bacterium]|nr:dTDP-4-dehydrorhamnose reductase [Bacteroidales bacterium]HPS17396.1 dTDP-4-dehydrorhamnose reductase [Bacteroidales bacterium]
MNILVTGANGQLGNEIRELAPHFKNLNFTFTDIEELDISNYAALNKFFVKNKFDCFINCAAYTAVDKAEKEKDSATLLNVTAVKYLSQFSASQNALLIHVSTDYVFDGRNCKPYLESDLTNPKSIYGKTKLDGEVEVIFNSQKAIIFRTSWLYSSYGGNFVKTILKIAKEKESLNVVCDQVGSPTYARDLAKTILEIVPDYKEKNKFEIFNFSNEGVTSWYDFAKEILEISGIKTPVNPIETKDYPTDAARPFYSVLNKSKIKKQFNISIPYWKDSLNDCIQKIKNQKK